MERRIVHLVADYGRPGDLAWSEVTDALYRTCPENTVVIATQVPPFSEGAAAFAAYQLARRVPVGKGSGTIVFTNVDARTNTREPIIGGDGNPLYTGTIGENNVRIVGPGLTTFAIAEQANDLHSLARVDMTPRNHRRAPGQFRSRDAFALIVAEFLRGTTVPTIPVSKDTVPALPPIIGFVDGYENLKTNVPQSAIAATQVRVRVRGIEASIRIVPGLFALNPGELGLYPGSSGENEDRFLELAVRYDEACEPLEDTAAKRFAGAKPGDRLFVTPIEASVGAIA